MLTTRAQRCHFRRIRVEGGRCHGNAATHTRASRIDLLCFFLFVSNFFVREMRRVRKVGRRLTKRLDVGHWSTSVCLLIGPEMLLDAEILEGFLEVRRGSSVAGTRPL